MGTAIQKLTCIRCPLGCLLEVTVADGIVIDVRGNSCTRGEEYGRAEVQHPVRIVTTTVPLEGSASAHRLPVKTALPVAKARVKDVMSELATVHAVAPIEIGDVIVSNVAQTGIDVVSTGNASV